MPVPRANPLSPDVTALARRVVDTGHARVEDLAFLRPSSYEDLSVVHKLKHAPAAQSFLAEVDVLELRIRDLWPRRLLLALTTDGTANLTIRLHNFNSGLQRMLAVGSRVRVFGQLTCASSEGALFLAKMEMVHPRISLADTPLPAALTPRYPVIKKLKPAQLTSLVAAAARYVIKAYTPLPVQARTRAAILPLAETLRLLHAPKPGEETTLAQTAIHSLKYEEWLAHILLQQHQRLELKRRTAAAIPSTPATIDTFAKQFPFSLTSSQRQAMCAIAIDLAQPHAMRRLLHGDVGCGKTLVAAYACWLTARAKLRSAIMCPTVILASQHHLLLQPVFQRLGLHCILLIGSMRARERKQALATLAKHPDTVVIGTHTLFQGRTELPDLALAVIDEQQRFGVAQRQALERKSGGAHVLMLSATPIPRTLELGMLAHLDITCITERPKRGKIHTLLFSAERADEVLRRISDKGLQAYWICPLIKRSAKSVLRAAEDEFERIRTLAPQLNASLIHGKLANAHKLAAMRAFQDGTTRLLVATTVVEVGVDAPEADVIVIDNCERLGLSQLHQLRGRVGRGDKAGFCALLYEPTLSAKAKARLQAMHTSDDGFEISQHDLLLRGPGDIIGKRQSGTPKYRFAAHDDDPAMLEIAREVAEKMIASDPQAAQAHIQLWLGSSRAAPAVQIKKSKT